jgi:hypothetical protein
MIDPDLSLAIASWAIWVFVSYLFLWEPVRQAILRNELKAIRLDTLQMLREMGVPREAALTTDKQLQKMSESLSTLTLSKLFQLIANEEYVSIAAQQSQRVTIDPYALIGMMRMLMQMFSSLAFGTATGLFAMGIAKAFGQKAAILRWIFTNTSAAERLIQFILSGPAAA